MWNFLFLVLPPSLSEGGGGVCVQVASFPNVGTCLPCLFCVPTSTTSPRFRQACICCPVSICKRWRSKSAHSLLFFCNGLETAKCRGLWYLRAHKSGLPHRLPSQPAPPSLLDPITSAHPASLLSLTWMCVIISSSSDCSLKWIIIFRRLKGGHSVLPKGWICEWCLWRTAVWGPPLHPYSLPVKHTACHQPSGLWSEQAHYREEESRIRENRGEEEKEEESDIQGERIQDPDV